MTPADYQALGEIVAKFFDVSLFLIAMLAVVRVWFAHFEIKALRARLAELEKQVQELYAKASAGAP